MAQLTINQYQGALKQVLLPYIQDNLPKQTIMLDQLKRGGEFNQINNSFSAPVWTTRHGGVANLASDASSVVNSAGRGVTQGSVAVKIPAAALDISKLTIDATKSDTTAVESALMAQSETLLSDFKRQLNRQFFSDGVGVVSQVLGSVSGTEASVQRPNANLDDGRSVDWYGSVNGDINPLKYITVGNILGVGTGGAAYGTVSAVTGTSVQFTGTLTIAADDAIYIGDGAPAGAGTSEVQGARLALASTTPGTYAGISRSVVGWTPTFGSVSESLTLSRMERNYIRAKEYSDTNDSYVIFVNSSLYAKYGDLLTAMRRVVNTTDLGGGWSGLDFQMGAGKCSVYLDYDVPDGEVLIINMNSWTICQVSDVSFADDGDNLLRKMNTIIYQKVMVWFMNLMCLAPAANGRETQKTN